MKKVILFLSILFAITSHGQKLDTVLVRNLQLRAGDWAYLASHIEGMDSVNISLIRRIRTKVKAISNPLWTSQVIIDSLPGAVVLSMYRVIKNAPAGEYEAIGLNISTVIKGVNNAVLQYYVGTVDALHAAEFNRRRNLGKNLLID